MSEEMDYGQTLNLPKTNFKMKAKLPTREPNFLKFWEEQEVYKKGLENKDKTFILHDGPPYANGDIHIGHVLNKILKDIILKYKRLNNYYSPYVPGWDTHGLPIENKVRDNIGLSKFEDMSEIQIREKCTKHAKKFIEKQKKDFIRLGILGEWENPYITLNPQYEAKQLEVFAELWDKGYVFKGLKPVYWSTQSQTSLAESDIDYKDVVSPSIYVKFEAKDNFAEKFNIELENGEKVYCVIWTTTPWTIPGNVAISVHPEYKYSFVRTEKGILIVAKDLIEKVMQEVEIESYKIIKEIDGKELEYLNCRHPFLGRDSMIILGEHVTVEAGTGCVHTAPGHGQEDYVVGIRYKLPVLCPVNNKGVMTEDAGEFAGLYYAKANKAIVENLNETNHLLKMKEITHPYPHSDRDKAPVIFRATEQWFVKVEEGDIREKALKALEDVEFYPEWGRNRIQSMIESRPDWCISRQRTWGVPIPIFYDERNGKEVVSKEIILKVAEKFKTEGSAAWIKYTPEELLGDLKDKIDVDPKYLIKDQNIMDVWFDSGVSHSAVLDVRDYLESPADMYLEGSDQHRGWFQTSLLTSVGAKSEAPYKNILTHGFVVDGKGHKMSKSVGNVVSPQEVIDKYGADILRLWCASVDYRVDIRISDTIIKQMSEAYRRIRNTARYILGNTADFSYKKDGVSYNEMMEIDKWALHKLEQLKASVTNNYEKYEFYNLFHDIHYFAAVDMSSFYLDILKDRLYTSKKDSVERRSAQTVMYIILRDIVKMISPVLSFTAEEIWQALPENERETESVLLADWVEKNEQFINENVGKKWNRLYDLKGYVNKFLEESRREKIIGHSLNAKVKLYSDNSEYKEFLHDNFKSLEDLFIVSGVEICNEKDETFDVSPENKALYIKIEKADGEKCERCWKYSTELGKDEEHKTICPRCLEKLS